MSTPALGDVTWLFATTNAEGATSYRLGRRGDDWIGEWAGCVWLEVTDDGRRIALTTDGTVDPFFLTKIERGPVAALERRLRGELTVHASATASDDGAIVVLGASGAGKSTTAAALVRERGHALLADDVAWIDFDGERAMVAPTEAHSYLSEASTRALGLAKVDDHVYWDDATKCGVVSRVAARPTPLGAIAVVDWGETLEVERVVGVEAMRDSLPLVARCGVVSTRARIAELDALSRLLASVFVYRVRRPKRFDALHEYVRALGQLTPRTR